MTPVGQAIAFLIGFYALMAALGYLLELIGKAKKAIQEARKRREPCEHGVRGGWNESRCPECVRLKEEAAQKADLEHKKKLRKQDIAIKASRLRNSETERIRKSLLKSQDYLRSLSPQEFEDVVAELFRSLGYDVKQTPYTNDQCKDAIIFKDGKKSLIECKRYGPENKVGRPMLQKFYAAMQEEHAGKGFFVSTGTFTSTSEAYASKYNIELINVDKLVLLIQEAYPDSSSTDTFKTMCLECGEVLNIPLKKFVGKCSNDHIIKNDLDLASISQMRTHPN
jgi:restriction system protein